MARPRCSCRRETNGRSQASSRGLRGDPQLAAGLAAAALALAPDYTWDRRAERLEAAFAAAVSA